MPKTNDRSATLTTRAALLTFTLLLAACGPRPFDYQREPITRATLSLAPDSPPAACPGQAVQLAFELEGQEGRQTRPLLEPPAGDDEEAPALLWSDIALESPHGEVDAGGVFRADDDVLRAFREGYLVRAQLTRRPEVNAEVEIPATHACLQQLQVGLVPPSSASGLELSLAYIDDPEGVTRVLIRLETAAPTPGLPPYVIIDADAPAPFELHLTGVDAQAFDQQVTVNVPTEHPELLDLVSLFDPQGAQILTPPKIVRDTTGRLFADEIGAGHGVH